MRRWQIVLLETSVIISIILFFLIRQDHVESFKIHSVSATSIAKHIDLNKFYETANNAYFGDRLPKDTLIDWTETGEAMARTDCSGGKCRISFNEKYIASERYIHITEYHEMCHIETWDEQDYETEYHGPRWRACMLRLDIAGAFRREIIDYYQEKP
jgi:predicted SprT family Zn-dependent metalloprotease